MTLADLRNEDTFRITTNPVTSAEAKKCALELEVALGEIANNKRKVGSLPLAQLCKLITYAKGA